MALTDPALVIDYFLRDPALVFAMWRRSVLCQVRQGELTGEVLARVEKNLVPFLVPGRVFGALLVVEAAAPLPSTEVRSKQRELMGALTHIRTARIAVISLGDDLVSLVGRSSGRVLAAQMPNTKLFADVPTGAKWLSTELAPLGLTLDSKELVQAYEMLRAGLSATSVTRK